MSLRYILTEKKDGISTITINRPDAKNALNLAAFYELHDVVIEADHDDDVKIILLTGAGRGGFCSGRDLKEYASSHTKPIEDWTLRVAERGLNFHFVEKLKKPIIAVINGDAVGGGCELALACDIRICSAHARFSLPEIDLDAFPGMGGTWLLPRIIGKSKAMWMVLTGEWVDAKEALEMGLVDRVVPSDKLIEETVILANKIASKHSWALQMAKFAMQKSVDHEIEGTRTLSTILRSLAEALCESEERISRFKMRRKI
jgi:enoyl-CoA hydratase